MSPATPQSIQTLQRTLCLKAKREPTFRFYSLYDKVYRADIAAHACALSKANGGAPGVDGVLGLVCVTQVLADSRTP